MIVRIHIITFIFILLFGCTATDKNYTVEESSSLSEAETLIDTTFIFRLVFDHVLQRLQGQQILHSEIDEDGNYYIEFNKDSTNSDFDDINWGEYYQIEKDKLITGKLNSDDKPDFAVRSINGPTKGNIFGLEWHIYVSDKGKYNRIENSFGGGKFSDIESVVAIDKMKIYTQFQELDKETAWLKDSIEFREYELIENELKRMK
jgi:hypothetical protein